MKPKGKTEGAFERVRVIEERGMRLEIDLATQVLSLSAPEHLQAWFVRRPGLHATPGLTAEQSEFVPAAMLAFKAKQFDDGLVAAVECAAQRGAGALPGMGDLVKGMLDLARRTADAGSPVHSVLRAAAVAGGERVKLGAGERAQVRREIAALEGEPGGRPCGVYTWSEELTRIYRQHRILQLGIKPSKGAIATKALVTALAGEPALRRAYEQQLALREELVARLALPDLRPLLAQHDATGRVRLPKAKFALFPASEGPETRILDRAIPGNAHVPEGFSLADEVVASVRKRGRWVALDARAGWYDRQLHALEPLLLPGKTPEARRLRLSESYRKSKRSGVIGSCVRAQPGARRRRDRDRPTVDARADSSGGLGGDAAFGAARVPCVARGNSRAAPGDRAPAGRRAGRFAQLLAPAVE